VHSTYWRNSWKYQDRAYRHCFWDNGTILANLLAVAAAHDLPARVVAGFVDDQVNRLIGVDGEHEAALTLVPLGFSAKPPPPAPPLDPISYPTVPCPHARSTTPRYARCTARRSSRHRTRCVSGRGWRRRSTRPFRVAGEGTGRWLG
jgi:hypothetical protein